MFRQQIIIFLLLCFIPITYSQAGEWIADIKTGCKVWNPMPEPGESIKWSGSCLNNNAAGNGILQWYVNGKIVNTFEGEFKDDNPNGKGTFIFADGGRYEGEFKDGKQNGKGTNISANGERYEGEFKDGEANGKGVVIFTDGGRYEGEVKDGKQNGKGTQIFANGDRYEGEFKDGIL